MGTHQGLERWRDAHRDGSDDLLEVAHLPQQPKQPEGPQHPQLLNPRVAAAGPATVSNDQEGHRHGDDARVEEGPAVCAPLRLSERARAAYAGSTVLRRPRCSPGPVRLSGLMATIVGGFRGA